MENQTTLQTEMIDQATRSIRQFRAQREQKDEINTAGWKDNFARFQRMLLKCGIGEDAEVMAELTGVINELNDDDEIAHLVSIRRAGSTGDVMTHLLSGRDSMLVPIKELDDVLLKLVRIGSAARDRLSDEDIAMLHEIIGYVDGVIYSRLSQVAAGLEPVAA